MTTEQHLLSGENRTHKLWVRFLENIWKKVYLGLPCKFTAPKYSCHEKKLQAKSHNRIFENFYLEVQKFICVTRPVPLLGVILNVNK